MSQQIQRGDLVGFLTGVPSEPVRPRVQYSGFGAGMLNQMQNNVENMRQAGYGIRGQETPQARQAKALANLDLTSVEGLTKLATAQRLSGDLAGATQTLQQIQAINKSKKQQLAQEKRREGLINEATKLGLTSTVELLKNNGSLDEAAKQIRSQEEKQLVATQGRKGKIALAQSRNAGDTVIQNISKGEYDSLSNEEFLQTLSGEKAELKIYQGSDGVSKPYRVNDAGKVFDAKTEKWVFPSELDLRQAPKVTQTIADADKIASKLRDKAADNFFVANEKARSAEKVLQINANSRQLMEEGIITGAGANFLAGMASIGTQLGLVPQGVTDSLVATQTFMAERGKQVLALLGSGDVGAGTGISDKDVQFMKEVAGQQITLNEETLSRIMRIEEQAARNAIEKSNDYLETMKDYIGQDEDPRLLDTFYVPLPEPTVTGYVPTQAAKGYLEQARQRRQQPK